MRKSDFLAASPLCLLLLAAPASAYTVDCSSEQYMHSLSSVTSGQINLVNNTGVPVAIYWLDYNGVRTPYGTVQPGQTFTSQTYVSHPWVAASTANGQCLAIYFLDSAQMTAQITAPFGSFPPVAQSNPPTGFAPPPVGFPQNPSNGPVIAANPPPPPVPPPVATANIPQGVNGHNVTTVTALNDKFTMLPIGRWVEQGSNGAQFNFVESGRDDWSVYLTDTSRGVQLQLDLFQKQIYYSDASSPKRPLYAVTGASAEVNGRNVEQVNFAAGRYVMNGPGTWAELGNNGSRFNFTETNRDDWSVYLNDPSRGVQLQLDLFKKQILYSDHGAPMVPLYVVSGSSAIASGP